MVVLSFFLIIACFTDYRRGRIPNELLLAMSVSGAAESYLHGGTINVLYFIIKAVSVVLILYPVFRIGAIGAGDTKLLGICSGFISKDCILHFLFFSMLIAAVFSIIKMCIKNNFRERLCCLCTYIARTVKYGKVTAYFVSEGEKRAAGLCMSGPVLCSILMHMGGIW